MGVHAPPHAHRRADPLRRTRARRRRAARPSPPTKRGTAAATPTRCAGVEIPLGARIIAVCDSFDAMISDRPYAPRQDDRRGARRAAPLRRNAVRPRDRPDLRAGPRGPGEASDRLHSRVRATAGPAGDPASQTRTHGCKSRAVAAKLGPVSSLALLTGVGGAVIGAAATLAARSSRLRPASRAFVRVPEADPAAGRADALREPASTRRGTLASRESP